MRSSTFLTAAFAIGALASPILKRDVVTEYEYVTDVVYVTAGAEPTVAAVSTPTPHYGGYPHSHHHPKPSSKSSVAPAPPPSTPAYTPTPTPAYTPAPVSTPAYTPEPVSTPEPEPSAPSGGYPTGDDYQSIVVRHHNVHRANHSAPALEWSDELASIANDIGKSCVYKHDVTTGGGGYGQNIAAGASPSDIGGVITGLFYNSEVTKYPNAYGGEPDMGDFEEWGHFSQVVWKDTTQVGCATFDCSSHPGGLSNTGGGVSPFFTVCNYKGPGNYGGEFHANVLAPLGHASVDGDWSG